MELKRLITDLDGTVWLRIEDAGYMDEDGRIWLVGRVKWRVVRNGRSYWSTVIEQKVRWVGVRRCEGPYHEWYLLNLNQCWLCGRAGRL